MSNRKEVQIVERDGVRYVIEPVRWSGKIVGFAPTLEEPNFDEEKLKSLAIRQYKQDSKNVVRGKYSKEKVTASAALKAIANREIDTEEIMKVSEQKNLTFTDAAGVLMGIGKDAKIDPEKIHWDIL